MSEIEFSAAEKAAIVEKIKGYFSAELDQDIAQFDAEFLLGFFAEQIGPYFYNRALQDAQALLMTKLDDLSDALYAIEKPIAVR